MVRITGPEEAPRVVGGVLRLPGAVRARPEDFGADLGRGLGSLGRSTLDAATTAARRDAARADRRRAERVARQKELAAIEPDAARAMVASQVMLKSADVLTRAKTELDPAAPDFVDRVAARLDRLRGGVLAQLAQRHRFGQDRLDALDRGARALQDAHLETARRDGHNARVTRVIDEADGELGALLDAVRSGTILPETARAAASGHLDVLKRVLSPTAPEAIAKSFESRLALADLSGLAERNPTAVLTALDAGTLTSVGLDKADMAKVHDVALQARDAVAAQGTSAGTDPRSPITQVADTGGVGGLRLPVPLPPGTLTPEQGRAVMELLKRLRDNADGNLRALGDRLRGVFGVPSQDTGNEDGKTDEKKGQPARDTQPDAVQGQPGPNRPDPKLPDPTTALPHPQPGRRRARGEKKLKQPIIGSAEEEKQAAETGRHIIRKLQGSLPSFDDAVTKKLVTVARARFRQSGKSKIELGLGEIEPALTREKAIKAFVDAHRKGRLLPDPKFNAIQLDLGQVKRKYAARILKDTKVDISGLTRTLDAIQVGHAFRGHGPGNEQRADQLPISPEAISIYLDVVENYDKVSTRQRRVGTDSLTYEKRINGTIFVVEERRKETLAFFTAWIKKR